MKGETFVDQLQREVFISEIPKRIVSLVPSQTDLLNYLNLDDEVVGITKFCIHPKSWHQKKERVGGTKNLNLERIVALKPDLIIGNKEENSQEDITSLSEQFPVWMSDINSVDNAIEMIKKLGALLNRESQCEALTKAIVESFKNLHVIGQGKSVLYFIWNEPRYVVGNSTYIGSVLEELGFINQCTKDRYPDIEELSIDSPDYIFLSSEPYPFTDQHIGSFEEAFPHSKIILVNGEMFSWYGSFMLKASKYFKNELYRQL